MEGIGQLGAGGGIGAVILGLVVCYFLLQSWNAEDRNDGYEKYRRESVKEYDRELD